MDISSYVTPLFALEIFVAIFLFIPFLDTWKRKVALSLSKQSCTGQLKFAMWIACVFLLLAGLMAWREMTTLSGDGDAVLIQKALASRDCTLCFSTLLMLPLMTRYFAVMSEMRRLEQSDIA